MEITSIQEKIHVIREQRVMLDFDLAELYGTQTKRLKEAVRRNFNRFPADFMFQLTKKEFESLRTQIASSKQRRGGTRYLPFVFTEQGVAMLASVLNNPKAIGINIQIVRAFVFLRQQLLAHHDLSQKLRQLEGKFNKQFDDVHEAIDYLLQKDIKKEAQGKRKLIGFKTSGS